MIRYNLSHQELWSGLGAVHKWDSGTVDKCYGGIEEGMTNSVNLSGTSHKKREMTFMPTPCVQEKEIGYSRQREPEVPWKFMRI